MYSCLTAIVVSPGQTLCTHHTAASCNAIRGDHVNFSKYVWAGKWGPRGGGREGMRWVYYIVCMDILISHWMLGMSKIRARCRILVQVCTQVATDDATASRPGARWHVSLSGGTTSLCIYLVYIIPSGGLVNINLRPATLPHQRFRIDSLGSRTQVHLERRLDELMRFSCWRLQINAIYNIYGIVSINVVMPEDPKKACPSYEQTNYVFSRRWTPTTFSTQRRHREFVRMRPIPDT